MNWTDDIPTKEGWYWMAAKEGFEDDANIVKLKATTKGISLSKVGERGWSMLSEYTDACAYFFSGPIKRPKNS